MNESERAMTRYLLGDLSEREQTALEERYFSDPQVFDELVKVENELVDDYARGRLDPELRERFDQYYLAHPKRRERTRFAQALATKLDQIEVDHIPADRKVEVAPWWRRRLPQIVGEGRAFALSLALVLLLLTLGGGWLLVRTKRLRTELAQTQAAHAAQEQRERELQQQLANERARNNDLNAELSRARSEAKGPEAPAPAIPTSPGFVTLLLTAGGTRGSDSGSGQKLIIPPGTEQVRIHLNLKEAGYSNYRVVLQAIGAETILSRQGLKPKLTKSGSIFVVIVPARRLATGDYMLTLKGVRPDAEVDDVSKFIFHVEKK